MKVHSPEWFDQQILAAQKRVSEWPEWMKQVAVPSRPTTDRELLELAAKAGRCAVSASKRVRQIPIPMDDKIEAWVQQAMQLADARELARSNVAQSFWSNEAKEQLARASDDLAAHLRTTPEGFVLVPVEPTGLRVSVSKRLGRKAAEKRKRGQ